MNEVSKIHLGRQAFTISADAHKALQDYLAAIKKQVGDAGVVDEVELRMAELLIEHGITGDKVVLLADVNFIKEQLGNPTDFKEDSDDTEAVADKPGESKRLFRDTENGMLAGVAAGLAAYTGIDVLLIRILFIIGVFTGGWGILVYLLIWLLAPEAKTTSDRLQMVGKPVTVNSLKEVVDRADVKGAARRANNSLSGPINSFFRVVLKIIGILFIITGLSTIFGLITAASYVILHNGQITQYNIFPVGFKEHMLVDIALFIATIISIFIILAGMAMFRRKWPIRTWVTGLLVVLLFIGFAAGGALAADVAPTVRDRYNSNFHYVLRTVPAFNKVKSTGDIDVEYQSASTYSVVVKSFGSTDVSPLITTVTNGTLLIDSSRVNESTPDCHALCIPLRDSISVTVRSPNPPAFIDPDFVPDAPAVPTMPSKPFLQQN